MERSEYEKEIGLKVKIIEDDDDVITLICIPGYDPITCVTEQDILDANTIIETCSADDISADSLWTLLCVGLG